VPRPKRDPESEADRERNNLVSLLSKEAFFLFKVESGQKQSGGCVLVFKDDKMVLAVVLRSRSKI